MRRALILWAVALVVGNAVEPGKPLLRVSVALPGGGHRRSIRHEVAAVSWHPREMAGDDVSGLGRPDQRAVVDGRERYRTQPPAQPVGLLADPNMIMYIGLGKTASLSGQGLFYGHPHQLLVQFLAALTIIVWDAIVTAVIVVSNSLAMSARTNTMMKKSKASSVQLRKQAATVCRCCVRVSTWRFPDCLPIEAARSARPGPAPFAPA